MCVHYEWSNEGKQAQKSLRELINDAATHKTNFSSLLDAKLAAARYGENLCWLAGLENG